MEGGGGGGGVVGIGLHSLSRHNFGYNINKLFLTLGTHAQRGLQ